MSRGASFGGRELTFAACVLGAALLAVFWRPIASYGTHVFSPADVAAQASTLTRVEHDYVRTNSLLTDPALETQPWLVFNKAEFAAGRVPLWNPYNGCGVPHLANYQSAPFSLFSLPFYVLPFDAALIVASLAKLFALALFTYLFLHQIGLARFAAWCGALAFATSGFALLLHQYPHAGAMLAVPGGLYFAERVLQDLEDGATRVSLGSLVGLTLVLVVAAYAGHPETLAYGVLVLAAYCAWRAWGLLRSSVPRARTLRACASLVIAGLLAAGIAAPQLLPFVEYLSRSATLATDRGAGWPLARANWPLAMFPNLAGAPMGRRSLDASLPAPNYEEFTSFYVGGVVLFAAALSLAFARRDRRASFFAALAFAWIVYAWNVFGIATWLAARTPLGLVPIHRTHPLSTTSLCVLAAVAIDRLERFELSHRVTRALAICALGSGMLAVFLWRAEHYVEHAPSPERTDRASLLAVIDAHVLFIAGVFGLGVLGLALLVFARYQFVKYVARAAIFAALLLQGGGVLADYVPTVPARFLHPRTPGIEALREHVGDERWIALSGDTLPADYNLVYGLSLLGNRDALQNPEYEGLLDHFFGGTPTLFATRRGLELFGVRYVATKSAWVPIETELSDVLLQRHNATVYLLSEFQQDRQSRALAWVKPDQPWRFEFIATRANLDRLCLHLRDEPGAYTATVAASLVDLTSGARLVEREFAFAELHALPDLRRELVLEFEPQPYSCDRIYALQLESRDQLVKVVLGGLGKGFRANESALLEDRGPALDIGYGRNDFEHVGEAADFRLARFEHARGSAWIVARAIGAASSEHAFELVKQPDFEPYEEVVLEGAPPQPVDVELSAEVELLERTPQLQRWRTHSSHAGYLVVAQCFFPGWRARVDGQPTPLWRANHAFSALALPAGEHTVELAYEPASFALGLALAAVCAALGAAALLALRRARLRGP